MPVTTPVEEPIVAIAVFELDHVPPGVPSLNVVVPAVPVTLTPDIGVSAALTVTGWYA
jgi:hypothetical protein